MKRGISVPSASFHATNNILVPKNLNADRTSGVMRITSDFRALNLVTKDVGYRTEDVKRIVLLIATKRLYSLVDMRYGCYNVKFREGDRHLTSIWTEFGLY